MGLGNCRPAFVEGCGDLEEGKWGLTSRRYGENGVGSMLTAKGLDLGRPISGVNFDRRRVRILAPFGKLDGMETGVMFSGEVMWIWNLE